MKTIKIKLIILIYLLITNFGFAQSNRSIINDGVDKYEQKKYADAEIDFRKVVGNSPKNFEANFNLGNSYYKQSKYEDAVKAYQNALENVKDNENRAKIFHNIGNSLLKSDKIEQSIEAYKNALKYNPKDSDTKYNLSYALELLKNKNKDQHNKNDKNNKDQNKQDKQQNQDQNQNQNNKSQNQQNQNQQNQNQPEPKDQEAQQDNTKQQQQPKEEKISKEEAQRILDALKNNEKDLQKQLRKRTGQIKKTDKDW